MRFAFELTQISDTEFYKSTTHLSSFVLHIILPNYAT